MKNIIVKRPFDTAEKKTSILKNKSEKNTGNEVQIYEMMGQRKKKF